MSGGTDRGPWTTLRYAIDTVLDHPRDTLLVALLVQGAIVVAGIPAALRLFGLLDSEVEITSPTALGIGEAFANPLADLLLLALVVLIAVLAYIEVAVALIVARRHQSREPVTPRVVAAELGRTVRRLGHPSGLLLIPYLLVVLPGGPLGLALLVGLGIRVPDFATGELLQSWPAAGATAAVLLVLLYMGLRLAYTLPLFLAGEPTVLRAMVASWRATRGQWLRALAIGLVVVTVAAVLIAGTFALGMLPVRAADAAWPDAAPVVAGVALTLIQLAWFAIVAVGVAILANAFTALARRPRRLSLSKSHGLLSTRRLSLSKSHLRVTRGRFRQAQSARARSRQAQSARAALGIAAVALVVAALTVLNLATVAALVQRDDTLVIAHRGLLSAGVENTIPALEGAAAIHPDLVEIDIQQTADGEFVVMHDPTLERLAGRPDRIRDLTLAQLQRIELRQDGQTALIDALDDYIDRAVALDQRLLVELKINGDETPDYLDRVIATLERHGVLDEYWVHSLDKPTIEEFEAREPQVPTGFIMTFNLGHAPQTTTDFVVMQELSYTQDLRDELWAAGRGLFLWSVDDVPTMRNSLRDNVDGIISYEPDLVQTQRASIEDDTSVADRVESYARRLLGW